MLTSLLYTVDVENRAAFLTITLQRWLGVRLDALGNVVRLHSMIQSVSQPLFLTLNLLASAARPRYRSIRCRLQEHGRPFQARCRSYLRTLRHSGLLAARHRFRHCRAGHEHRREGREYLHPPQALVHRPD